MLLLRQQRRRIWLVKNILKFLNQVKCWVGFGHRVLANGLVVHLTATGTLLTVLKHALQKHLNLDRKCESKREDRRFVHYH